MVWFLVHGGLGVHEYQGKQLGKEWKIVDTRTRVIRADGWVDGSHKVRDVFLPLF